ncbi:MAG: 4-oxalocrotonate tautomerase family protein [Devosia sp.]|jgi:4-oxalocrotonate tautomerase
MPFVTIRIVRQAIAADPEGKKQAVASRVAEALAEITGLPATDVWTVFEEVEATDWYLGQDSVQSLRFSRS